MDLYASKSRLTAALDPIVHALAARGVAPDAVTMAAVPVAVVGAACLLASPAAPWLLLAVPFVVGLRLLLNLLDGALARTTGRSHPRGELLNELGDRVCDVVLLAPVAVLPGASVAVVLLGVLGAVLASFVGVVARAAGGRRLYRGTLSKPGRMVLLAASAVAAFVAGPPAWTAFGILLLAGTTLTLVERAVIAFRELP